jgi:hypothetical protein
MKLLSNYFKPAACGALKERFGIIYVEQAQALSDQDLLLTRNIGLKFVADLRAIQPDPDGPTNYHPFTVPLLIGTIISAFEQLPNPDGIADHAEHRIPVVQMNRPITLVFRQEKRHYWQWELIGVETVN